MRRLKRMSLVSVKLKKDNFTGREMKNLRERLQKLTFLNNYVALWGWFDGAIHKSSNEDGHYITLAYLAYIHHVGYEINGANVPARPVLLKSLHQLKDSSLTNKIGKIFSEYCIETMLGKSPSAESVAQKLAQIGRDIAQSIFGSAQLDRVSEATIQRRKQSKENTPLVDTGELRDEMRAIASKVGQKTGSKVV